MALTIEMSMDLRRNSILFAPDVKKWEEIKYMEYGRYIHQQLKCLILSIVNIEMSRDKALIKAKEQSVLFIWKYILCKYTSIFTSLNQF